jgi:hypothetical protein
MAQPPTTPFLARQLVRTIPFAAQFTAKNPSLANNGTIVAEFDVAIHSTDANSFLTGAFPGGTPIPATGQNLDALVFTVNGAGTLLVEFAVDLSCTYRAISNSVVPAATATNISGLRITGRFVRITFTNTSGGPSSVEFGAYVRSA